MHTFHPPKFSSPQYCYPRINTGFYLLHIDNVLFTGGSKQKECFIYHKVASVLYEK